MYSKDMVPILLAWFLFLSPARDEALTKLAAQPMPECSVCTGGIR